MLSSSQNESPITSTKKLAKVLISRLDKSRNTTFSGREGATINFTTLEIISNEQDGESNGKIIRDKQSSDDEEELINVEEYTSQGRVKTNETSSKEEINYVRKIRPLFQNIFTSHDFQVVDSQHFPWLFDIAGDEMKPDLFLAPRWAYTRRATKSNPIKHQCGTVPSTKLYDSVYILDCKLVHTYDALGELIQHLQLLNASAPNPQQISKGMLFGPFGCDLMICQGQDLVKREFCHSGTPGIVPLLLDFFTPFSYQYKLSMVLNALDLQLVEPNNDGESAFLGAGAFGRVFKVKRNSIFNDPSEYALKIVYSGYLRVLQEFSMLEVHTNSTCLCNRIASIPSFSELKVVDKLCCFVMSPVGVGLKRDEVILCKRHIEGVIQFLKDLHSHSPPYIHGDARVANIVKRNDDSLFWIDFATVLPIASPTKETKIGFYEDMKCLVKSLTYYPISHELLHNYSNTLQTNEIIEFVWRSVGNEKRSKSTSSLSLAPLNIS